MVLDASELCKYGSGATASITMKGGSGNRVRLRDGEALLKGVRIEARACGTYTLHARPAVGVMQVRPGLDYTITPYDADIG